MKISNDIYYVGVNDYDITLFEGQYPVKNGMCYNSYVIMDEKIAIMDSVDRMGKDAWINQINDVLNGQQPTYLIVQHMEPDHSANIMELLKIYPETIVVGNNQINDVLNGQQPTYLIVQHMEPDHSANIMELLKIYPETIVVGNVQTFNMMQQFFHTTITNKLVVKDGDELTLGKHTLKFLFAPMVHWPEVMMSYDTCDKVLFSADGFGKFVKDGDELTLGKHTLKFLFAPMVHWPEVMMSYDTCDKVLFSADGFGKFGIYDADEPWEDEARRYYIGICGKYGMQVSNLLKKASNYEINAIAPLHGPVLSENLAHYIKLYLTWANYEVETPGTVIAYSSVYGNTKQAALYLAEQLRKVCENDVITYDLNTADISEVTADAFRYSNLVLASITYNATVFPSMKQFIDHLTERNYQKRNIALIENGSWAPLANKVMKDMFANSKNINILGEVSFKSSLTSGDEFTLAQLAANIVNG